MTDALVNRYPALGYSLYRRYWLASFASVGATQLVALAQGWLVFRLTGRALDLGLLGAATALPNILMSLFGGVVADRFDKRKIILVTSVANAALLFLLAALDASGAVRVWHVMTIAAASSVIAGIEWPTRQALFPHLIERPGLLSAVALNSVLWQSTRMIMPALGGVLIALTSTGFLFALSGVGFLVMFGVMLAIPLALPGAVTGTAIEQIRQGISFIAARELFRWLILLSYSGMFFVSSYMQLMPAFAQHLDAGETGYGFLLSATGVGSVVGTFAIGAMQRTRSLGWVLLGGAMLSGVALYGFALAVQLGWYPMALAMAFASSVCASIFMISSMTVMQLEVPDTLRGRVMGIHSITYSLMPLGGLLLGAIANASTVVVAVVFGASAYLTILIAVAATRPSIRAIDGELLTAN
ncbi:MAG TPA: MFS transporter [Pseudomonadales bacterium]|nr:MFS transporter [Pseudomonadales bacterium]